MRDHPDLGMCLRFDCVAIVNLCHFRHADHAAERDGDPRGEQDLLAYGGRYFRYYGFAQWFSP